MESNFKKKKKEYFFIPLDCTGILKNLKEAEKYYVRIRKKYGKLSIKRFLSCLYLQAKCNNLSWDLMYVHKRITQCSKGEDRLFDNVSNQDVYDDDVINYYKIEREIVPINSHCVWEIPKDVLIVYLFKHVSIQDLGRLEQTSKDMKKFIKTHDFWKNVIVKRDIGFYNYAKDVECAKDYLKRLLTGNGFRCIRKIAKEEESVYSCDNKQILLYTSYTNCCRILCSTTEDYYYGFMIGSHGEQILCFQGDLIFYITKDGHYSLRNYKTNNIIILDCIFGENIKLAHIFKDVLYYVDDKLRLKFYDFSRNSIFKAINLMDKVTDKLYFCETYMGLCLKGTEGIYDINLNYFFSSYKPDYGRYRIMFGVKPKTIECYDIIDDISVYNIVDVWSIETGTSFFIDKNHGIIKLL